MVDSTLNLAPSVLELLDPEVIVFLEFYESLKNGKQSEVTKSKGEAVGTDQFRYI